MDPLAFGLVLGAAVLHAGWNLAIKASKDRLITAWAQVTLGALVFAPFLIGSGVPWEAWPSLLASTVVHLLYGLTLVTAYGHGDLSVVYPVARGTAPVLVTVIAGIFLADWPTGPGLVAIALVVAGVLLAAHRGSDHGIWWALAVSGFIAAYTIIDGAAVRDLEGSFSYTVALFLGNSLLFLPVLLWRRGARAMGSFLRRNWLVSLAGGAASAGAYTLVLIAARFASLGLVSAVRETSVVWGALGGWLLLREADARSRMRGVALIVAGLVILAVSR